MADNDRKSVWVVMQGQYSDTRVDAVFSTEEKAEQYIAQQNEGGGEVNCGNKLWLDDEYELDEIDEWVDEYKICLAANGDVEKDGVLRVPSSNPVIKPWSYGGKYIGGSKVYVPTTHYGISRRSRDHALKLAAEERQRHLRTQAQKTDHLNANNDGNTLDRGGA